MRDVLDFGRWIDLTIPGGLDVHGLWTWHQYRAEAPGQPRELTVSLNDEVFLSGAATDMKNAMGDATRKVRRARLLVPVLRHDVPFRVGRCNDWGAVWSVAERVLVLLVDNAAEIGSEGGLRIDLPSWRALATEAGIRSQAVVYESMAEST